ncbi:hypothetical protein TanjilG_18522 [Lupinus angustifolius]|uniref:TCP domain-containing protein n=1 Tax=Lupinus angustifolius TaxID=3871 RepID=A0A4P1RX10_LUPAN|nr:PREDICTED: transcription factor CYCLOIDEA isoform X2 [Lupinus angustifolius]OIW19712.1 hypothetical protein TanjilG_18522 [Lupinus angustifolius]
MYSSNSSINGNDLIPYPIQFYSSRPFSIESNPTSTQLETTNSCDLLLSPHPPLSYFQFPFPFEDHEIFLEQQHHHDLLHHQHSLAVEIVNDVNMENTGIIPDHKAGLQGTDPQVPIRKSSKRDRHSKINTAKGLRDRRMRLSLLVAKRFFSLQDMLGFDKASKTVDWLLNQAKVEIKQLAREKNMHHHHHVNSASSTSECTEAMSSLDEIAVSGNQEQVKGATKRRRIKVCRKSAFKHVGKESREKARQRARERTRDKMMKTRLLVEAHESKKQYKEGAINNNLNCLSSWNPFEIVKECAGTQSQSVDPSLGVMNEAEERSSQGKEHFGTEDNIEHEDSLVIMSKWSPTMIFNYSLSNTGILQEHQFSEFQSMGKPWGAYNNHNISSL